MENILLSQKIKFEYGFRISYDKSVKIYDFYLPEFNVLLEVDGIYWHAKNSKKLNEVQMLNKQNDKIKNKLAVKHGYRIIRIWSDEISIENLFRKII